MWLAAEEDKDEEEGMATSEGVSWLEGRSEEDSCVSARDIVLNAK